MTKLQANYNFGIKCSEQIPFCNILNPQVLKMIQKASNKTLKREGSGFHKGLSRGFVTSVV